MTVPFAAAVLPPLAAPGIETLISIAVLLMGVIGWVVQLAQQGKAQQANRRPPGPNPNQNPRPAGGAAGGADEKLRNEIDSFLQEVSGRRAGQRPANQNPPARRGPPDPFEEPRRQPPKPEPEVPEFLRSAARRERTNDRPEPARRPIAPVPTPPPAPPRTPRGGAAIKNRQLRKLSKKNLGGELREHVERYMAVDQSTLAREHVQVRQKLDAAAKELSELKRKIADPNDHTTLGGADAGLADPARLRTLLANPAGVRDAIVVNELLAKPLGLRGPRSVGTPPPRPAADPALSDPAALA